MSWTRREFLVTTGLGAVAAAAVDPAHVLAPAAAAPPMRDPRWLVGDPYLATALHPGLGSGSFDALRDHALRFRTPGAERDRQALGVEIERA